MSALNFGGIVLFLCGLVLIPLLALHGGSSPWIVIACFLAALLGLALFNHVRLHDPVTAEPRPKLPIEHLRL